MEVDGTGLEKISVGLNEEDEKRKKNIQENKKKAETEKYLNLSRQSSDRLSYKQ